MYNPLLIKLIGGMDEYDSQALPGASSNASTQSHSESGTDSESVYDEVERDRLIRLILAVSDSELESGKDSESGTDSEAELDEDEYEFEFNVDDFDTSQELLGRYNEAFSENPVSLNDLISLTLHSTPEATGTAALAAHSIAIGEEIQTLFPIFELFNFNTGNDYLFYQELGYSPENIEKIFKADPRWYILSRIQQYAHTENEHISRNFSDLINILQESPVSDNNILFFEARFELIDFILSKYNPQQKELFLSLKYNLDNDLIHEFPYSICSPSYFVDLTEEEDPNVPLITPSGIPFIEKQELDDPDIENFLEHKITLSDFLHEYSQN